MDEYEVDLRDYLIVIWQQKWVIIGVVLLAIAAAGIYSFTQPDEYRAEAMISYQSSPPAEVPIDLPETNGLISMVESTTGVRANPLSGTDLVRLGTEGTAALPALEDRLQSAVESTRSLLQDQLDDQITQRFGALDDEIQFLQDQRSALLERLEDRATRRLEALGQQRDQVVAHLDQLMNGGAEANADGPSRQASLLALTSQLQILQQEMARLETSREASESDPSMGSAYAERLVAITSDIQERELTRRRYERLQSAGWTPLSMVQAPQGLETPVGPNRMLNVAIAGVLGAFIGLLLAFFVHYLRSGPAAAREQRPSQSSDAD